MDLHKEVERLKDRETHLTAQVSALSACVVALLIQNPSAAHAIRQIDLEGPLLFSKTLSDEARHWFPKYLDDLLP